MERIERVALQDTIIAQIKKHIYENQLSPGDMLLSQANISLSTGASRASVREAVKTMEAQGLLRTINGKGIYVENIDTSFHVGLPNMTYLLRQLIEQFSVRKALEGMAVEQCTLKATDSQLQSLSELLLKVEARYYKREYQADVDLLFHQTLVSHADNHLLTHMLKNIMQYSGGMWRMEDAAADILSASIPSHRVMMDYILARDAKAAVDENNKYMDRIIQSLTDLVP